MTSSKVWIRISAFALLPLASAGAAEWKFPCPENEIARYTAYHVAQPIRIDGRLDEPAWQRAPRSPRFRDILTGRPVIHDTRASVLWDDENLYIAYRVEEPLVHAKLTTNNSPIYTDNDVEFFVAGRDAYYEFEINAFNTTYEAFFIWADAYQAGGFAQAPEFERSRLRPFNGVDYKTHPRGGRLGNFDWHFPGKQTAVFIDGTINDDTDRDRGWTVELALPWKGMAWLAKAEGRSASISPTSARRPLRQASRLPRYSDRPVQWRNARHCSSFSRLARAAKRVRLPPCSLV
jgi:hypothetical protein